MRISSWSSVVCSSDLLAFVLAGALTADHYPLPWVADVGIALPDTYQWGTFIALTLGTLFIATYAWQVAEEARRMSDALVATQMALAREQQVRPEKHTSELQSIMRLTYAVYRWN